MSNNTINSTIAQALVAQAESTLKSFRGIKVTANKRSVWVTAPKTGKAADALKGMGYKYAESKQAWWLTYALEDAPEQKPAKTAPKGQKTQPKAEPKPKTEKTQPKAEKTEKPQTELTTEQKALADKYARMFPQAQVSVDRTWVWLKCEKDYGKTNSESLKAEGFWFSQKREAWYRTPEHAQVAQAQKPAQKTAPKAEPKKAQPKAKTATKKGGVVRLAEMYA